ncbi:hypothetical protein V5O48_018153, partial [Marasmius crinis-equi]
VVTDHPCTTCRPLSKINGWNDYHEKIFPDFAFATQVTAGTIKTYHPDPPSAIRLLATKATCFPLTVIAALEDVMPTLSLHNSLSIHVVGAATRELLARGMLEELLHFLPKLKTLKILFVGPETIDPSGGNETNLACEFCVAKGRSRTSTFYKGTYHDFVLTPGASANRPDLIVGLNTGMSEVDHESWKKTIGVIRDLDVPALFTCYTKREGESEMRMMKGMGVKIAKELSLNKWRGVVPKSNNYWNTDDEGPIAAYNSYYKYIAHGRA